MCYRFPIFGTYVVVIVFGECVIVFQPKPCVTNPMSSLYISPMTDKKATHHIGIKRNVKGLYRDMLENGKENGDCYLVAKLHMSSWVTVRPQLHLKLAKVQKPAQCIA